MPRTVTAPATNRRVVQIPARRNAARSAAPEVRRLRLAAYCRVSTDQDDQLHSFENQREYFNNYVSHHPEYQLVGIYADEGISGLNTRRREDFNRMIADCEAGKIDVVITKSISRFARNTADCLMYSRKLKDLGIAVIFEKENINTLDGSGELLFTILSSLAQEESRSISENTTWGIRYLFSQGVLHLNTNRFLGYDKDENGNLVINQEQAKIVRYVYHSFLDGNGPGVIARRLQEKGVPGVMGEPRWTTSTIQGILTNEKYTGDALLQKTYTSDYLNKKTVKNDGTVAQVWVKGNHEPIIDKETWNVVQLEIERRTSFLREHGLRTNGRYTDDQPFSTKVFCGKCGTLYMRRTLTRLGPNLIVWMCSSNYREKGVPGCGNEKLPEPDLHCGFVAAWNTILQDRDAYLPEWLELLKNREADPLRAFRAQQMIDLTADAPPMDELDKHIVNVTLERVLVHPGRILEFRFLTGTTVIVALEA